MMFEKLAVIKSSRQFCCTYLVSSLRFHAFIFSSSFFYRKKEKTRFSHQKNLESGLTWLVIDANPIESNNAMVFAGDPVFGALPIFAGDKLAEKPSGKLTGHNRKSIIWRCISYWKRWISIAPPVRGSIYHSPRNESLIRPLYKENGGSYHKTSLEKLLKGCDFDFHFWPQSVKSRWSTCRTSCFSSGHVSSLNTAGKLNM